MASQICTHTAALSGWIVCVVEEFTAKNDRVLNLRKGDVIQLVSTKDDDGAPLGDGWLLGKHAASGKIGRYPRGEYIKMFVLQFVALTASSLHYASPKGHDLRRHPSMCSKQKPVRHP